MSAPIGKTRLIVTKYVDTIDVADPDTGLKVPVEIRKLADGSMVGLDGSYLESIGGLDPYEAYPMNPYDENKTQGLLIQDDEKISRHTKP